MPSLAGASNIKLVGTESGSPDKLAIEIHVDLRQPGVPSSTGKTQLLACSSGNRPLGASNITLGLNLYYKGEAVNVDGVENNSIQKRNDDVSWERRNDTLVITMSFGKDGGRPSASGKTMLLCSGGGNFPLGRSGLTCGLNCYHAVGKSINMEALEKYLGTPEGVSNFGVFSAREKDDVNFIYIDVDITQIKEGQKMSTPGFLGIGSSGMSFNCSNLRVDTKVKNGDASATFRPVEGAENLEYLWASPDKLQFRFDRRAAGSVSSSGKSVNIARCVKGKLEGATLVMYVIRKIAEGEASGLTESQLATIADAVKGELEKYNNDELRTLRVKECRGVIMGNLASDIKEHEDCKSAMKDAIINYVKNRAGMDAEPQCSASPNVPAATPKQDGEEESCQKLGEKRKRESSSQQREEQATPEGVNEEKTEFLKKK